MATIDVALPDVMKDWVEEQARAGRYNDASDYLRELIRRDQERVVAITELQRAIDEGFESGVSDHSIDEVLAKARARSRALQPS